MRLIARLALAAALLTPAVLRADTPATTQWVVTSAKATGGNNQYVTSLRIVNPNAVPAPVDITLFAASDGSGDNGANPPKVSVLVPANSTLAIDDVLATKFGDGRRRRAALRFDGHDAAGRLGPLADARRERSELHGSSGTNGFAIPSQNTEQLVAVNETAYVPYISSSTSASSGYRTNLFLLSANGTGPTVVTVSLLKGDGTALGTRDVTLARYAQTQINNIAASFGYSANDTNLTATVKVKSGGPVATGASVIDNAIASISYSPPMKVARANNGAYGLLLNDGGFEFSGRVDIIDGNGDYMTMSVVVPNCNGANYVFYFQAFGASSGTNSNASFVAQSDGSISFSGAQPDGTFSGTIVPKYDGTVTGTLHYTRAAGSDGAPCPGVGIPGLRATRSSPARRRLPSSDLPCPVPACGRPRGAALFAAAAAPARAADLYGKPLRGLSPVSVAAVVAAPANYAAKAVRVEGKNEGPAGKPALKEGDAVLPIVTDGSYALPENLAGGTLAAEGKAAAREGRAVFVATGVEVRAGDSRR